MAAGQGSTTTGLSSSRHNAISEPAEHHHDSSNVKRVLQALVDFLVVSLLAIGFGLVYLYLPPYIGYFSCDQSDIFYPFKEDTIAFWVVGLYGTLAPILVILAVELANSRILDCGRSSSSKLRIVSKKAKVCYFNYLIIFNYLARKLNIIS